MKKEIKYGPMTPKMLYELAKAEGVENKPIGISYECSDSWYSFDLRKVDEENCYYDKDNNIIKIFVSD